MQNVKIVGRKVLSGLSALFLVVFVWSCASAGPQDKAPDPDVFAGAGQSDSLLKAMNAAKMDAVRKAVISEIGEAAERSNQDKLNQVLYNTNNPNQFVLNDTMVTNRKDNVGTMDAPMYDYEITIKVNRQAIVSTLKANGITGGGQQGQNTAATTQSGGTQGTGAEQLQPTESDVFQATEAQKSFIRRYVDKLTYLVYYNEESSIDPLLIKGAIGQANSYLVSNGYTAIDAAQVERLKKDQQLAYEEQTGGEISLIQWIAQSLNADVYIELDGTVDGETSGRNHYAQASLTLKMYETSTGQLLGSQPYNGPRAMSTVSLDAAKNNVLQSSVYTALPVAIQQSKELLAKQFANGIRYEVILQNTSDARVIANFRQRLRRVPNVADVATRNQSADQATFDVFFYGRSDELLDAVFDLSGTVTGLENLDLVLTRGKSLTFDSGL